VERPIAPGTEVASRRPEAVIVLMTSGSLCIVGLILGILLGQDPQSAAMLGLGFAVVPFILIALGGLRKILLYTLESIEPAVGRDLTLDGQLGHPVEDIRLLPGRRPERKIRLAGTDVGFYENDLLWMIDQLPVRGVVWRNWQGVKLPSGLELTEYESFKPFPEMLVAAGVLVGRTERQSGKFTTHDTGEIRRALGV
jgi:hypothetical protein